MSDTGCEFGQANRELIAMNKGRLARISGAAGAATVLLALVVASMSMLSNWRDDRTREDVQSIRTSLRDLGERYHVPESEHIAMQTDVRTHSAELSELKASLRAQEVLLEDVRGTTRRIEDNIRHAIGPVSP